MDEGADPDAPHPASARAAAASPATAASRARVNLGLVMSFFLSISLVAHTRAWRPTDGGTRGAGVGLRSADREGGQAWRGSPHGTRRRSLTLRRQRSIGARQDDDGGHRRGLHTRRWGAVRNMRNAAGIRAAGVARDSVHPGRRHWRSLKGSVISAGWVISAGCLISAGRVSAGRVSAGRVSAGRMNSAGRVSAGRVNRAGRVTAGRMNSAGRVTAGCMRSAGWVNSAGLVSPVAPDALEHVHAEEARHHRKNDEGYEGWPRHSRESCPKGSRPQGSRPQGSRPQGSRPQGSPQESRPEEAHPRGTHLRGSPHKSPHGPHPPIEPGRDPRRTAAGAAR